MKVTIVVPVFNAANVLDRCVTSILSQSYNDLEVILIDDGSSDGSSNICDNYSLKDQRVKVIHKINEGVSLARNEGIFHATGDFLMFVDSDDFIEFDMIKCMVSLMTEEDVDLIICGADYIAKSALGWKKFKEMTFKEQILRERLGLLNWFYPFFDSKGFNNVWGKLYKTAIIKEEKILFNHEQKVGEDALFNLDYFNHINSCAMVPRNFYKYCFGVNLSSKGYDPCLFEKRMLLLERFQKFCLLNSFPMDGFWWFFIKAVYASLMSLNHKDCKLGYSEKILLVGHLLKEKKIEEAVKKFQPNNIMEFVLLRILKSGSVLLILAFSWLMRIFYLKLRRW